MSVERHSHVAQRINTLKSLRAEDSQIKELLAYNQNLFVMNTADIAVFPLPDESFVEVWEEYADAGKIFTGSCAVTLHS